MENKHARYQVVRELINERTTPEEERAVMTWIATRPPEQMKLIYEAAPAVRAVYQSLLGLLEQKVDAGAPETQALIVQLNDLVVRNGVRDLKAAMFEWNAPLAQKWSQMSERALSRILSSQTEPAFQDLIAYIRAAQAASPWGVAIEPIVDEAAVLAGNKVQPSVTSARVLVDRLRRICADYSLGAPLVYARWARAMQSSLPAEDTRKEAAWTFLAAAIESATANPGTA